MLDGATVRIGVTDDGPGVSPEVRRRSLEPFFTTKARGISTGLGLALVHGIVQKAGGAVEVESQIGIGSSFMLIFPAAAPEEAGPPSPAPRALLTIPDVRMRTFLGSLLRGLGLDVAPDVAAGSPPAGGDARLWVVGPGDGVAEAARTFLDGGPDRWVFYLGRFPAPARPARLVEAGERLHPAEIRRTLDALAAALAAGRETATVAAGRP